MYVIFIIRFFFEQCACDGCQELLQKAMSLAEVTIVSVKENSSRIHFWEISKESLQKSKVKFEEKILFIWKKKMCKWIMMLIK